MLIHHVLMCLASHSYDQFLLNFHEQYVLVNQIAAGKIFPTEHPQPTAKLCTKATVSYSISDSQFCISVNNNALFSFGAVASINYASMNMMQK